MTLKAPHLHLFYAATDSKNYPHNNSYLVVDFSRGLYLNTINPCFKNVAEVKIPLKNNKLVNELAQLFTSQGFTQTVDANAFKTAPIISKFNDFAIPLTVTHSDKSMTTLIYRPVKRDYMVQEKQKNAQISAPIELGTVSDMRELITMLAKTSYNVAAQSSFELRPATRTQFANFMKMMREFGHSPEMTYGEDVLYIAPTLMTAARYYDIDVREFEDFEDFYNTLMNEGHVYKAKTKNNEPFVYVLDAY